MFSHIKLYITGTISSLLISARRHRTLARRHWQSSRGNWTLARRYWQSSRGHRTLEIVTWRDLQGHRNNMTCAYNKIRTMVRRYYLKIFVNNSYVLPDNRNAKRVIIVALVSWTRPMLAWCNSRNLSSASLVHETRSRVALGAQPARWKPQ